MSALGIFHTVIGIIAIVAGAVSYFKSGKIDQTSKSGQVYIGFTFLTCLTAFGIFKTGHLSPAHHLTVLVSVILLAGLLIKNIKLKTVALSSSYFLSWVPTIIETLTRLPVDQPLASGPEDQIVQIFLGGVFIIFAGGLFYQLKKVN